MTMTGTIMITIKNKTYHVAFLLLLDTILLCTGVRFFCLHSPHCHRHHHHN